MRPWLVPITLVTVLACSSGDGDPPAEVRTRAVGGLLDAAVTTQPKPATAPAPAPPEPAAEGWLDPMPTHREPWQARQPTSTSRPKRVVQLTLRSTPPGATVMIDGEHVGITPTFWEGEVTSTPRDFVFILPGHAIGRYRFVATHDSIVHPSLKKLVKEKPVDAGP